MPRPADLEATWQAWLEWPFPPGVAGAEVAGVELVLLDSDTAGVVTSALRGWDTPGQAIRAELDRYHAQLETVVPLLNGQAREYFEVLQSLVVDVLTRLP